MITSDEQQALLQYLEFLLEKEFLEPIVDKHIKDPQVVSQCHIKIHAVVEEIEKEMGHYRSDTSVDRINKPK